MYQSLPLWHNQTATWSYAGTPNTSLYHLHEFNQIKFFNNKFLYSCTMERNTYVLANLVEIKN